MKVEKIPLVTPLVFEGEPRKIAKRGNSYQISIPTSWAESVPVQQDPRAFALLMRQYLIYYPVQFNNSKKEILLDLAMTSLEALLMIAPEDAEDIKEAWKILERLEDKYTVDWIHDIEKEE